MQKLTKRFDKAPFTVSRMDRWGWIIVAIAKQTLANFKFCSPIAISALAAMMTPNFVMTAKLVVTELIG